MKIAASSVSLSSSRMAVEQHEQSESLRAWRDGGGAIELRSEGSRSLHGMAVASARQREASAATPISISPRAQALQPSRVQASGDEASELSPEQELEFLLLKMLVERFTGHAITVFKPADACPVECDPPAPPGDTASAGERQGWGISYDYYEAHYEAESTGFSAQAVVQTADGQTIEVALELNMSREFRSSESLQLRAGDAVLKDPLVINFDGNATELTKTTFAFDIDADGRKDQIAFVGSGSGFLALDRNGNGKIDDGGELFGALSGNGFADLATYDGDGNGWIDENDGVYDRLRIWSRDAEGSDRLVALGDADVGAIYLGHLSTEFKLADGANVQQGQIRQTGLYLKDSGGAGTVQQIDLVV